MRLKLFFLVTALTTVLSCSDFGNDNSDSNPPIETKGGSGTLPPELRKLNQGKFSEAKMLANIGINVIAKNIKEFSSQANLLKNRVDQYCEDLDSGVEVPASEKAVREQWENTMYSFHVVNAANIGPAAKVRTAGEIVTGTIADNIYAWPFFSACGVDRVVEEFATKGTLNKKMSLNRKGLSALEYVLFDEKFETDCSVKAYPAVHEWNKKPVIEKKKDRCAVAQFYAEDIVILSQVLNEAWDPSKENYTANLVIGSEFKSVTQAVNALTNAMFILETMKDKKLGAVLGLLQEKLCDADLCPENIEHCYSGFGLKAIGAQLEGFKETFYGARNGSIKAFGFDDYLTSKGHPELVQEMEVSLNRAINDVNNLAAKGSFDEQLLTLDVAKCQATTLDNPQEPLCALYAEIRTVTTALKTDVLTILSLSAPAMTQGDND